MTMKIMRSNYDKPWRCPGWSGPAFRSRDRGCPSGSGAQMFLRYGRAAPWKFWRCPECGTLVLPAGWCWFDPTYIVWRIRRAIEDWRYERSW